MLRDTLGVVVTLVLILAPVLGCLWVLHRLGYAPASRVWQVAVSAAALIGLGLAWAAARVSRARPPKVVDPPDLAGALAGARERAEAEAARVLAEREAARLERERQDASTEPLAGTSTEGGR